MVCKECGGEGIIFYFKNGYEYAKKCKCRLEQEHREMVLASGIADLNVRFDDYKPITEQQKKALAIAKKFVEDHKGFCVFCGQVGSGKTMLSNIIANELLEKEYQVVYMPYQTSIIKIKQNANSMEGYNREIDRYTHAEVLVIDDLYKAMTNETDLKYIFEIINYRYANDKPTIISSERSFNEMLEIDEAIASRIYEKSKGYAIEFKGKENNYRMYGGKK